MSANSLYGRLAADLNSEYSHRSEALHRHMHLINRFGEAIKSFNLTPHARTSSQGDVSLVALSRRGEDAAALQAALVAQGAAIGQVLQTPNQFNDGFVMWTAPVRIQGLEFTLLFYTKAQTI